MTDSPFLDGKAAAAYLGICQNTLYANAYNVLEPHAREDHQTIPGQRIGRKWLFHRDVLDAWGRGEYRPPAPPVTEFRQRRSA